MSPYYVIDILCLAVMLGMIASLFGQNDDLSRLFRWDSWSIAFMCLSEFILSVAIVKGYRQVVQSAVSFFICCASCMSYIWYFYVTHRLGSKYRLKRNVYTVTNMAAISFFCFVIWASTKEIFFHVARNGRLILEPYFLVLLSFVFLFSLLSLVVCIKHFLSEKDHKLRRLAVIIGILTMSDIVSAIVQYLTYLPVICISATISMLYYFISVQESRISLDSLTRLNNRSRLDLFFRENFVRVSSRREESFLIFIDVNKFKLINDSYGHNEGDRALTIIADAMRSTDYGLKVFNSRISGDEFVTVLTVHDVEEVENYVDNLRKAVSQKCSELHAPYDLSISVGYARIPVKCDDMMDVLKDAEENMYRDKRKLTGVA